MRRGIAFALVSAVLFGLSAPLAKLLLGHVGPWMLAGLLYLGSGLGLAVLRPMLPAADSGFARTDLPWLAAAVVAGGIAGPLLLMLGLSQTPAASAALLLNLEGVFTLGLAWVVFREGVDQRIAVGAAAILAGAVLLSWQGWEAGGGWGMAAIAGACLCWAIDNNLTRQISAGDPVRIAMVKGLAAGGVNTALALALGDALPGWPVLMGAGVLGLAGYGLSLVLFVLALRHLGTARTGAYFSSAPFVGAVLAVPLLGEVPSPALVGAGALMALGLWLHLTEDHAHDHAHDAMEHEHPHSHDAHHEHDHDHIGLGQGQAHIHRHAHRPMIHRHPHFPDIHHRHGH